MEEEEGTWRDGRVEEISWACRLVRSAPPPLMNAGPSMDAKRSLAEGSKLFFLAGGGGGG